jgi:hypothetical protein
VEILVHITAPSRGPDDARYRALAHAYLNFEPARRHKIENDGPIGMEKEAENQLLEELHQSTQEERESEASYRPDEKQESAPSRASFPYGYQHVPGFSQPLSSPHLSFNSVLDSPVFRPPNTWQQRLSRSDAGGSQQQRDLGNQWTPAPSTIADSQPENDRTMPAVASPTTVLELILQQNDTSDDTSLGGTASQRSTHYGSQTIPSSQDKFRVSSASKLTSSPMPINGKSHLRISEVQVARTSSADEVPLTRSPPSEAHPSLPANKAVHVDAQLTTSSENATPDTPTPVLPQAKPDGGQARSSSQSFGSVVPATSTPPILSSSGREIRTEEEDAGVHTDSKLEIPATSTHGTFSSPLPAGVSKGRSRLQFPSFEREIPETATAPVLAQSTQSANPEKQPESTPTFQRNPPPVTQEPHLQSKRKWPDTIPGSEQISSSAPLTAASKSFPESSRPQKRQRRELASSQSATTPARIRIPLSDTTQISMTMPPSCQIISSWTDKLEIRAPIPATASTNLTPEILITTDLSRLEATIGLTRLFYPAYQARDLRPMERGYWLVNCDIWSPQVRVEAWKRLGDFVGKSKAGWGVCCVRDEDCSVIRVYCWGFVVGHIYLLLFMSSGNKISNTGASWIGGDGQPLIKMPC